MSRSIQMWRLKRRCRKMKQAVCRLLRDRVESRQRRKTMRAMTRLVKLTDRVVLVELDEKHQKTT